MIERHNKIPMGESSLAESWDHHMTVKCEINKKTYKADSDKLLEYKKEVFFYFVSYYFY